MHDDNPILRQTNAIEEITHQAKEAYARYTAERGTVVQAERASILSAREIGKLLVQAKSLCKHGEWIPRLEKIGINRKSASVYMRIFKCLALDISKCESIRDAMKEIQPDSGEGDEPAPEREPGDEGDEPPPAVLCKRCRENGHERGCKECAILNSTKPSKPPSVTNGAAGSKAGGAAMSDEEKERRRQSRNATRPELDWNSILEARKRLAQAPDDLYRAYGMIHEGEVRKDSDYTNMAHHLKKFWRIMEKKRKELDKGASLFEEPT